MHRCQCNKKITNSHDKVFLLETSNHTAEDMAKCSIAETEDKDCKIDTTNMLKDIKDDMHKFINEIHDINSDMK